MKYSIAYNAINSLDIAIRHFKTFFFNEAITTEEKNDHVKISLVFLENSIELFLKTILIVDDPESIYCNPTSAIVQQAKNMANENGGRLEDFLLLHSEDLRTIGYWAVLEKYDEKYSLNKRANDILKKLGRFRNSITHFGIDFSHQFDDLLCCFTETFDVIFNCLYPQLVDLDDVGIYFKEDGLFVLTPHGVKPLLDENFMYNNLVDFLSELMEITQDYVKDVCYASDKRKIGKFIEVFNATVLSEECQTYMRENQLEIKLENGFIDINYFDERGGTVSFSTYYSTFHNATVITDEGNILLFCVEHTENKLYIYYDESQYYPCFDQPENYYQWRSDEKEGYCKCVSLNQRNLLAALKQVITYLSEIE